jgi:hypothetical protein
MPSPQLNLRVPLEHHDLLRAVAARLRHDAAFAVHLGALLAGVGDPTAGATDPVADASTLASIMARLDALERGTVAQAAGEALEVVEAVPPPVPSDSLPPGNWSEEEAAALRSLRLGLSRDVPQEPAPAPARRGRSRKPASG